ncbi:hypothetical protein Hbl1158_16940 (plasmid) [Halobaculum sp. CBA1158]|uniref:hypothetical protein n=1 Tax=Halobaculum sp. CBA1158 TaxID=2904243 RepID=UPI001F43EEEE|nr:hypothetical protein [Halobaculum sp. CBA1158]UIP01741.1 hypothetical protein Hbl1158_16940 [Halobaculum sp. CBA1158]
MAIQNGHGQSGSEIEVEAEHAESEVIDEEKYSHKRRLTAIHNAHDRAVTVRDGVGEQLITGAITEQQGRRYYRRAVESLIMQLLPVLESDALSLEEEYASEVEIGTMSVHAPRDLVQFAKSNIDRLPSGAAVPKAKTIEVVGLKQILELPSPIQRQFSVVVMEGSEDYRPVSQTVETELQRAILDSAVQVASEALEDAQMGLNIGEGRPRNHAGTGDGSWPWETDTVLPHEIRDAIEAGEISREQFEQLIGDQ